MGTKLAGAALALVILFAGFSVVFADGPHPEITPPGLLRTPPAPHETPSAGKDGKRHGIFGSVSAKGSNTLTVQTQQGEVVVTVTSETKFHVPTKRNATFADVVVNDRVAVNGTPTASGLTAKQVAVAPGKPAIRHRVGEVTAFSPGASITIKDAQGGTETFVVTAQTIIRNPKGSGIAVGDKVTIVSRRDPSTDTFTAAAIVVHPQ
jgi:RNase P/RNase MRP subunit p29